MAATTLVQTRIDPALKERAAAVLNSMGLTVSDAANDGALPFPLATDPAAHDAWFRAKVQQALHPRPAVPHGDVEAHFAKRRAAALRKRRE
jgi:DNA-damage-inducible protein J